MFKIIKYRDLSLIHINENQVMVISCDSAAGIGNKKMDVVKTDPEIVGYYTAKVALSELIAFGVKPSLIVNNLCVERNDTGNRIIEGISEALKDIQLKKENILTGSTEDNIPVVQTGIGLTAIGLIDKDKLNFPNIVPGDLAVVIGIPKVGDEVVNDQGEILDLLDIQKIKKEFYTKDVLPVGSKGIEFELNVLIKESKLGFEKSNKFNVDLSKSAGPSTCAIVVIEENNLNKLRKRISKPINILGRFK